MVAASIIASGAMYDESTSRGGPTGLILAIESSCDETSAAIVRGGTETLANIVASQLIHADYGGVVPELASREHLRAVVPVTRAALAQANVSLADLDAIAVTEGPGLAGALLVGITYAKALAFGAGLPLIAVNHLEGHIHAVLMEEASRFTGLTRLLALVVSGGHTHLYLCERDLTPQSSWQYRNVGKTVDDAAGEAYDKAAKLLGLPYPGGPWMDVLSTYGNSLAVPFTFAQIKNKATGNIAPKLKRDAAQAAIAPLTHDAARFDFSFSGIKTAVRRYVETHAMKHAITTREQALRAAGVFHAKAGDAAALATVLAHCDEQTLDLIASFQHAVVSYLVKRTMDAAEACRAQGILVSGGVSANSQLRSRSTAAADKRSLPIAFPRVALSTDNAAMIAAAAWPKFVAGQFADDALDPTPQLRLGA
jgi:N6-L-threonylcarbamoyladenine synthase